LITVAVIDTNVMVAGVLTVTAESPVARVLDGMRGGHIRYLLSPALLQEYRAVMLRPRICARHGLSQAQVDALLAELAANSIWREPSEHEPAPDPGDDHLWSLLRMHAGAVLVTGDRLLQENAPDFAQVVSPADFMSAATGTSRGA